MDEGIPTSAWQTHQIQQVLEEYSDVFSDAPGTIQGIKHNIVTPPVVVIRVLLQPTSLAPQEVVEQEVKNLLHFGVIMESTSPWCSPPVLVPKPDRSVKFCIDFRILNNVSIVDAYPMPRVDVLINRVGKAQVLSTIELTKWYWQIPLANTAQEKAASDTFSGLYHFLKMPFGLHGASSSFQRVMDRALRGVTIVLSLILTTF